MIKKYFDNLAALSAGLVVTDRRGAVKNAEDGAREAAAVLRALSAGGRKAMVIGNGGSAGIAGHIAIDLLKNAGIPAVTFTDPSALTCLANDLGYEAVYQKPLELLAQPGDVLVAISSSGRSKNIIAAALEAQEAGCFIITLSGFDGDNPLRSLGDINVHVPSHAYGDVEITHLAFCHYIVDSLVAHG